MREREKKLTTDPKNSLYSPSCSRHILHRPRHHLSRWILFHHLYRRNRFSRWFLWSHIDSTGRGPDPSEKGAQERGDSIRLDRRTLTEKENVCARHNHRGPTSRRRC